MKNVHIGETIRVILKDRNISIKKAAEDISISEQGFHKALNKETLSMDLLERIMKYLNINLYEFLASKWKTHYDYPIQDISNSDVKEDVLHYLNPSEHPQSDSNLKASAISLLINIDESMRDDILKIVCAKSA